MYKKENHNNFTVAQYYNLLFLAPSNEWCTIFYDLLFLTLSGGFLSHSLGKKKESGGGFLKISHMKHPWVHDSHQSQNTPSPYLHSASDIDKLCTPLLFSFSLSNYWTRRRWTKAVHKDYWAKKKKKNCSQRLIKINIWKQIF